MRELIKKRLAALEEHFEKNNLKSFDPYDGLNTPFRKLLFKNRLLERLWLQTVRVFPVNLRGLFRIKKIIHQKTVSDLLSASSILYNKTHDEKYFLHSKKYFLMLNDMKLKRSHGIAWGLQFYFTTRFVQADKQAPNLFNTINSLNSLLDFYETLKEKDVENDKYLVQAKELTDSALDFIFNELGYEETESTITWNYWENLNIPIYNVNALMAGALSRYQVIFETKKYEKEICKTIAFLKSVQNEDGSWNYSSGKKGSFIDGFHTGYILEGLSIAKMNGVAFDESILIKGAKYYFENFFTEKYLPKYFNKSLHPIDGQNFAQAIQTLYYLNKLNLCDMNFIERVLERTDSILWNSKGYYNYTITKYFTYRTPMDRWVNGPAYLALSGLY